MTSVLPLRFRVALVAPPLWPINTVAPVVTGTASVGFTLTTSNGTWVSDGAITYTYQWCYALLNDAGAVLTDESGKPLGEPISGGTASTYVVQAGDIGGFIFCVVIATNAGGSSSADSNMVGPIT